MGIQILHNVEAGKIKIREAGERQREAFGPRVKLAEFVAGGYAKAESEPSNPRITRRPSMR